MARKNHISSASGLRHRLLSSATRFLPVTSNAVSEKTPRRHKVDGKTPMALVAGVAALSGAMFGQSGTALAQDKNLPQGGSVAAGDVNFDQSSANTLNVNQGSSSAIVNWQSFDIGSGNTVNFNQPSSSSVILNRVVGNDPSSIFGTMRANGTVMLVNPNGVIFGQGSRVDVGGLVATTANISDSDFMAGRYDFNQASSNPNASVVNAGDISIRDTGLAALVAPTVQNSGVIRARMGHVALGGAKTFSLDFQGDGLLSFGVGSNVDTTPVDADGKAVQALVSNSGQIIADGGVVELSARSVQDVVDNVINTSGVVQARSVSSQNGKIILSGGESGTVVIAGKVDATGDDAGETGGSIVATGQKIDVKSGADIDASGQAGGGLVAIGSTGDGEKGRGTGTWSETVKVASNVSLKADAIDAGDGGDVTVLSEDYTGFAGSISAKGGANGGHGGNAEVSSHQDISLTGSVDLSALNGDTGTFLLDPASLTIIGSGGDQDTNAGDGSVVAGDSDTSNNTVSASKLESIGATTNIVLEATGLITVSANLSLQTGNGNSFTLHSTQSGGIAFDNGITITTAGGSIALLADGPNSKISNVGALTTTNGGDITLNSAGDITLAGDFNASTGSISLTSIAGSISNVSGKTPTLTGGLAKLSAVAGDIGTTDSAITTRVGSLTIETGKSFNVDNGTSSFSSLKLNLTHNITSDLQSYKLASTGLTFDLTDSSNAYVLSAIKQDGMALNVTTDKTISVGEIDAGTSSNVNLTSNDGNITRVGDATDVIRGQKVTLSASGSSGTNGGLGTSGTALKTDASEIDVTAGSGGIYVANAGAMKLDHVSATAASSFTAGGTITVGDVSTTDAAITLHATTGDIIDDGDTATSIDADSLALIADAGGIGVSGKRIVTNASTISASANTGGVYLDSTASTVTFSDISSDSGAIDLTSKGAATLTKLVSKDGTSAITVNNTNAVESSMTVGTVDAGESGDVTLTSAGEISKSGSTSLVTGNKVTIDATGDGRSINLNTAAKTLDVSATSSITLAQSGAVAIDAVDMKGASGNVSISVSGGDATVNQITNDYENGAVSLSTSDGDILAKDANSLITSGESARVRLSASGNIGTNATHVRTATTELTVSSTGNLYVDNINSTLTDLSVTNNHADSTGNAIELTSDHLGFSASDDGQAITLASVIGANLSSFSFVTDQDLKAGNVNVANGTVSLKSTDGNIFDDENDNTRIITSGTLTLDAAKGNLGTSDHTLSVDATSLTLTGQGNIYVNNVADLSSLKLTNTHADSTDVNVIEITSQALNFKVTDNATSGYALQTVSDTSGLNFTFSGDRDVTLGSIDLTYGNKANISATSGSILDDGDKSTFVLATKVTLDADKAIGDATGTQYLDLMTTNLSATADQGGIFINVASPSGSSNTSNTLTLNTINSKAGDIWLTNQLGDINVGSSLSAKGDIDLTAKTGNIILTGNITSSVGSGSTVSVTSDTGSITSTGSDGGYGVSNSNGIVKLSAAKSVGSADHAIKVSGNYIDVTAGTDAFTYGLGALQLRSISVGNNFTHTQSSGTLTLGAISATSGAVDIAGTSSSLVDDGDSATTINAKTVKLSAGSAIGNSGTAVALKNTENLTLTAADGIWLADDTTLKSLSISQTSNASMSGGVNITTTSDQAFEITGGTSVTLNKVTSASALDFTYATNNTDIVVGDINVTASGSADLSIAQGTKSITDDGDTNTKVVAGKVSLAAKGAFGSVGASDAKIQVDSSDLLLSAGKDIYVASDQAISRLAVTDTSTQTSVFDISGSGGPTISIVDNGTDETVGISGASITNFSLSTKKSIIVSDDTINATGDVSLSVSGTAGNGTISSNSASAIVKGASVSLSTTGSGTSGAIGSSSQSLVTNTAKLSVDGNNDVYIDNSGTSLSKLDIKTRHSSDSDTNTYKFTGFGGSNSFSISESGSIQTVALTSSSALDFSFDTDRAIKAGAITAGSSSTGSVSLTASGGTESVDPAISHSGMITAGAISLSALGTDASVNVQTDTQKLTVKSAGGVTVDNGSTTALTDLSLNLEDRKTTSSANGYSINSAGLTFDVTDQRSGDYEFNIKDISQTGLTLDLKAFKTISIQKIDLGTSGNLTLTSGSSGIQNDSAASGNVITANKLTLNANSVYYEDASSNPLKTSVNELNADVSGNLRVENNKALTIGKISSSSSSGSVYLTANSGITNAGSSSVVSAENVFLISSDAAIGTSGSVLNTDTHNLTLSAGKDVYIANASDLFALNETVKTGSYQNEISATNLTYHVSNDANTYTLANVTDTSGLNFTFSTDGNIDVGSIDAGLGRTVKLSSTGSATNIAGTGAVDIQADTIELSASGDIGTSSRLINTKTRSIKLTTGGDLYIDNSRADLSKLDITSTQSSGDPTYQISADKLTFSVDDDGSKASVTNVTDTTGLDFSFNTVRQQNIGVINVGPSSEVTLESDNGILGAANASSSTQRITAGSADLKATNTSSVGSSTNGLHMSVKDLTVSSTGDVYVDSDTTLASLTVNTTHPSATAQTYQIKSVDTAGSQNVTLTGSSTGSGGTTTLDSLVDDTGLVFSMTNDQSTQGNTVNLNGLGTMNLTATSGDILDDGDESTKISAAKTTLTSSTGSIGATGANNGIDINGGTISLDAKTGITTTLDGRTELKSTNVRSGNLNLVNSVGDIALGSIDLYGNGNATITNNGGSILSGTLSRVDTVTLSAEGSIGNVSAISLSNSSSTVTVNATAKTNSRDATGSVDLTSSYGLTTSNISAKSDVSIIANNSSNSSGDLTVGTIATNGKVKLTSGYGSIYGKDSSNKISGSSVEFDANRVGKNIGTSGVALNVDTASVTAKNGGNIYLNDTSNLTDLSIDRSVSSSASNPTSAGTISVSASNISSSNWDVTDTSGTTTFNTISASGLNFTYKKNNGSIVVDTINVGSGDVSLSSTAPSTTGTTDQTTITASSTSSKITAAKLSLSATGGDTQSNGGSAIGSSSTALGLNVDSLSASSGSGGIYVKNDGGLVLDGLSTSGNLSVTASSGNLTVKSLSYGANKDLTLTATDGAINTSGLSRISLSSSSSNVSLTAKTGIGSSSKALAISGGDANLTTNVTGSGNLYLDIDGTLGNGLTADVNNGSINVVGNNSLTLKDVQIDTDAEGNDITVTTTSGDITIGASSGTMGVNAGSTAGNVNIWSRNGKILAGNADSTLSGYGITLTAAKDIGTSSNAIGASGDRVVVSTTGSSSDVYLKSDTDGTFTSISTNQGDINITGKNGATLLLANLYTGAGGGGATGGAVNVFTTGSGGNLIIGNIDTNGSSSAGNVALTATNGTIIDDGQTATRIKGGTLTVTADTGVGTSTTALETTVAAVNGTITGTGDLNLDNNRASGLQVGTSGTALKITDGGMTVKTSAGGITLTNADVVDGSMSIKSATSVTVTKATVETDRASNDISIVASTGDITVGSLYAGTTSASGSPTASAAKLTVTQGNILSASSGDGIVAGKVTLTANNGNIGAVTNATTGAGTPVKMKVNEITELSATGDNSIVSVANSGTNTVSLTSSLLKLGTGSSAYIKSGGDIDARNGLLVSTGNLLLDAGNDLILPSAANFTVTGGLTLKGGSDVYADGGARTLTISAGALDFESGAAGGDTNLNTTTSALTAKLTGTGKNLIVSNTGEVTSGSLAANGNITAVSSEGMSFDNVTATGASRTVDLRANGGNMTTNIVNAGSDGTVKLTASAGAVNFKSGGLVTADTLTLNSHNSIGSEQDRFSTNVNTLNATVTGTGDMYLRYAKAISGTLTTANGNIDAQIANGVLMTGGAFQSGGNGDIKLSSAGDIAVNSSQFTVGGSGNLVLASAGGKVDLNGAYTSTTSGVKFTGTQIFVDGVSTGTGSQTYTGDTYLDGDISGGGIDITGKLDFNGADRTLNTSGANGNIHVSDAISYGNQSGILNAGSGNVTLDAAASNVNNLTITGGQISVTSVSSSGDQTYNGTTTLNGTYLTSSKFNVNGATNIAGTTTVTAQTGGAKFGGAINSSNQSDLTLNTGNTTNNFNYAIGNSGALGTLTIKAGTNGITEFARNASIRTTTGLDYSGGVKLVLPANITVTNGGISLGVDNTATPVKGSGANTVFGSPQDIAGIIAELPAGAVTINANGDIVIAGLKGASTNLTMNSGAGNMRIGSKNGTADQKIIVKTLTVSRAAAANLYGTVAGVSTSDAAFEVGPLQGPPYYINDNYWQTRSVPAAATKVPTAPKPPSTPQVDALFNLNNDPAGLTANALGAYTSPTVLNGVGSTANTLNVNASGSVLSQTPGQITGSTSVQVIGGSTTPQVLGSGNGGSTTAGGTGAQIVTPSNDGAGLIGNDNVGGNSGAGISDGSPAGADTGTASSQSNPDQQNNPGQ